MKMDVMCPSQISNNFTDTTLRRSSSRPAKNALHSRLDLLYAMHCLKSKQMPTVSKTGEGSLDDQVSGIFKSWNAFSTLQAALLVSSMVLPMIEILST